MLNNYNYRIDDKNFILSQDEHNQVQNNIKNGKTVIYIRNGSLIINAHFIRYVSKTDQCTDIEVDHKLEVKQLPEPKVQYREGTPPGLIKLGDWVRKQDWAKQRFGTRIE